MNTRKRFEVREYVSRDKNRICRATKKDHKIVHHFVILCHSDFRSKGEKSVSVFAFLVNTNLTQELMHFFRDIYDIV